MRNSSMTTWEAQRMKGVPFSGIRKMMGRAGELEGEGKPVIHLEIGRPDFDTPEHIKAAARRALDEGKVHYTSNYGVPEIRRAIAGKLRSENGLEFDENGEIAVTIGANEAVFHGHDGVPRRGRRGAGAGSLPGSTTSTASPWPAAWPVSVPLRAENGIPHGSRRHGPAVDAAHAHDGCHEPAQPHRRRARSGAAWKRWRLVARRSATCWCWPTRSTRRWCTTAPCTTASAACRACASARCS